jgi:hypothetical protein
LKVSYRLLIGSEAANVYTFTFNNHLLVIYESISIVCTAVYVGALWWFFDDRLSDIKNLSPNNIGDFLAGVFGPLATFWLILGFFQQGIELRQNTHALNLQAEELHNSVEQQRNLVEVSRKQMDAELETIRFERDRQVRDARPLFVFHDVNVTLSGGKADYYSSIKNLGNTATNVVFIYEPEIEYSNLAKVFSWIHEQDKRLNWRYKTPQAEYEVKLSISYIDAAGTPGVQAFKFSPFTDVNFTNNLKNVKIVSCMV